MKLKGHQIIIFGLPRFDSLIESTNYITAKLLARENQVYYVDNPFTIKDYFLLRKSSEYKIRKDHISLWNTSLIDTDVPNLKIIIPPILFSINFLPEGLIFRMALKLNESLITTKLKAIISRYKIKDFIFINSFNFHYPDIAAKINPSLTVYHCLDPMVLSFNRKHGVVSEDRLVKSSDLVICSSKQLFLEKIRDNPNTYFVANAANLEHSSKALDPELPVLPIIADLKKPVIGYFGAIERRIDYHFLEIVIKDNPDKSFVFVGPEDKQFIPQWFYEADNVSFTGSVAYEHMPSVIKGFDVALIPFQKDEVSNSIFPLKLFEYLGAGKPVVAIDFNPDLNEFTKGYVEFCSSPDHFSEAINTALRSDNDELRAERVAVAADNTWDNRINKISDVIYNTLVVKGLIIEDQVS
ncbi:glycosyltransferase [Dyadobacter sp. CY356]|uniref:glycosyltransferase family protein n=1 Tax=Dyadobacter sp. CY356 TaxID=2906442 RepID=UPI001F2E7862|nr:glycosyltransferase [Dyadobacter sp. CY356]MCF0055780.1 glycosyltransferase [Dyadobacter sp. CY356]